MNGRAGRMRFVLVLVVLLPGPAALAQAPVKLVISADQPAPPAPGPQIHPFPVPPAAPVLDGAAYHGGACRAMGMYIVEGDYLLMRPRRRGQDYAIVGVNPNFAPLGEIRSVEGGFDSGFRVGIGYRFPDDGWEVRFLYTYFHTAGDDGVVGNRNLGVFPTLTHPAFVNEVGAASAGNSINLNLFDLELARRFDLSETTGLRLFAGPRYAALDQKFAVTYTGGDAVRDQVRRCLCFDGAGVRGGGELNLRLLQALGVYLRGSVSLMTGQFHSCLSEATDRRTIVNVSERFDKVIPVLDLGAGVSYQRGNLRVTLGYEFQNWFGMVEGFDFTDDAHPAKMTRRSGDLGFDGFVLRAEWLF